MLAAIQFPSWISPEIIPGLPFRWYGLMYVVAFGITWLLFRKEAARRAAPWTDDDQANLFFWAIVGLLIGARLFGTLVYGTNGYYWRKPWFIFWPFDETGRFTGFQGMSFHGGFLGVVVATLIYCRRNRQSWLAYADVLAVSAPLGYTFGRLGNFINGELWGKVTASPIGMVFPAAEPFSARETWVQALASKTGIPVTSMNDLVNLPRHPSQLYEAVFEGLALWALLWIFVRKRNPFPGFSTALYAIGYGSARFAIEYFREPDQGMGYIIKLGDPSAPPYLFSTLWNFSMGQLLSSLMILGGIAYLLWAGGKAKRGGFASPAEAEAAVQRPGVSGRKTRKRIK